MHLARLSIPTSPPPNQEKEILHTLRKDPGKKLHLITLKTITNNLLLAPLICLSVWILYITLICDPTLICDRLTLNNQPIVNHKEQVVPR